MLLYLIFVNIKINYLIDNICFNLSSNINSSSVYDILICFGVNPVLLNNDKPINKRHTLTKTEKIEISNNIPSYFSQVMVGVILSDGTLAMIGNMARLSIQQTHFELTNGLWLMCKELRLAFAEIYTINRNNWKTVYAFQTLTFPYFTELFKIWYVNMGGYNIKILPSNIYDLFTPISFAFLIMGDGGWDKSNSRIMLHLNNFTLTEIETIQHIFLNKFNIESTNYKVKDNHPDRGYIIAIPRREVNKVRELTQKHIYPSLLYKLGL